ncbi:nitroreductase family protein [Gracilimonas amylolytica]|uniref:nitroreductase family protein n=1 Tax=Gracilimonas amylolytica TaxID=1749045 RepID=UPI000CD875CF|nr:nitroreductase family protein [Gracilimonas amylolytica]
MNFYDALQWRYATKKMNGGSVPREKVDRIFEAIQMAPTSIGLQPFTVLHITDPELKEQIKPIAYDQSQITESSDLLVFTAWDEITEERIDDFVKLTGEIRDLGEKELEPVRNMANGVASRPKEEHFNWSARQAYIALGFGLQAAAIEEVDATPMEGFKNEELDELLGLSSQGLKSVALMTIGYREEDNDWLAPMKKVRRPKDKLIIEPKVLQTA